MDKQTDANVSLPRARRSFGTRTKARALKALQDYSKDSGRKWTLILGEILDLVGEPGARFGALTRQDLESWSRGDSELGDGKFSYIYDFLTHEETVGRPFFARLDLSERNELGLGRTLTEIFGPNEFRERGDAAAGRRGSDTRFAGVYSRADETVGPPVALKIWEVPGESFSLFHLIEGANERVDERDWGAVRTSGYLVGDQYLIGRKPGSELHHPLEIEQFTADQLTMWSGRGTLNGLLVAVKMAKFEHISGYAYALTRSDNNEFGEIFAEIGEDVG